MSPLLLILSDWVHVLLRLTAGGLFLSSGLSRFGFARRGGLLNMALGLALLVGFLVRGAALLGALELLVIVISQLFRGRAYQEHLSFNLLLLVVLLFLIVSGAGLLSLDEGLLG